MIANVYSVPLPLAARQPRFPAKQCGHRSRTGKLQPSQLAQCCSINSPLRAPSKNVALTVSGMGTGLVAVWDIVRFLLFNRGHSIRLANRCRPGGTGATLRSTPDREETVHETHVVPPDAL